MSARNSGDRTNTFYARYGKRAFDLFLSVPSLVILAPVFLASAVLIKLETSGPVTFCQERIGRGGRPFRLFKFRTMVRDASRMGPAVTSAGDPRITKVGRFLRRFKIDEMLQIVNVIKGDMSVMGPRPELKRYVEMFQDDYRGILKIRPGMTDYALIAFRDEENILSKFADVEEGYINRVMPEKIRLYKKYIDEMSLYTDTKIFFATIWEVVKR